MRDEKPASCGGRGTHRARQRGDQILDRAELVSPATSTARRHLQLCDQARAVQGKNSKISWTQVETGSAITWKYPSCILQGDNSTGEFYSVAVTNNYQQADTGTKMVTSARTRTARLVSKGHFRRARPEQLPGPGQNPEERRERCAILSQCDSLLIGNKCGAHTFPYMKRKIPPRGWTRSLDVEDWRGPDILLQPARAGDAGRREHES